MIATEGFSPSAHARLCSRAGAGGSFGVMRLDGGKLVHALDKGGDVGVCVQHGLRDAVQVSAFDPAEAGQHRAVSDGHIFAAEISRS